MNEWMKEWMNFNFQQDSPIGHWPVYLGWIITNYTVHIICDPLSKNLALHANIEFELEASLSVQVIFHHYTNMSQGAWTVSYWIIKPGSATIKTMQARPHRQASKIWERIAMDSLYAFFKKAILPAFSPYTVRKIRNVPGFRSAGHILAYT